MAVVSTETLACTYAALILHDDGLPIDAANIAKIIKAANVEVENFWPGMFAAALGEADVADLVTQIGGGAPAAAPVAAGVAAAAPAAGGAAKKEEKKKAPEPEEDEDMGFSLFD